MSPDSDPLVHRHHLSLALQEFRRKAGLTQGEVARRLDWSPSKVIRIEAGDVRVSVTDLRALFALYEIEDGATQESLVASARESRRRQWHGSYRDLISPAYLQLIGYESAAREMLLYHSAVIPGLLQTPAYVRALLGVRRSVADTERLVELRMRRQQLLLATPGGQPAAGIIAVLDEAAVRRQVGGADTHHEQLRHLAELMTLPQFDVRVIPFTAGAYRALMAPFVLLALPDGDVLFQESANGDTVSREREHRAYRETFALAVESALPARESLEFVTSLTR